MGQYKIIDGGPVFLPPGCRFFVAVRNVAPGARLKLFVRGLEFSETDLSEEMGARGVRVGRHGEDPGNRSRVAQGSGGAGMNIIRFLFV